MIISFFGNTILKIILRNIISTFHEHRYSVQADEHTFALLVFFPNNFKRANSDTSRIFVLCILWSRRSSTIRIEMRVAQAVGPP